MSEDWSPALGGDRAGEAKPEPPPEEPAGGPTPEAEAAGESQFAFDFAGFAELFGGAARSDPESAALFDALGAITRDLEGFVTSAASLFEQRLPETLAAFDNLVDAVETVLEPLFGEETPPPPRQDL